MRTQPNSGNNLWLALLAILAVTSPLLALNGVETGNDWHETARNLVYDPLLRPGPLSLLTRLDREVYLYHNEALPLKTTGSDGSMRIKSSRQKLGVTWPLSFGNQIFATGFTIEEAKDRAGLTSGNTRFNLTSDGKKFEFLFAHLWNTTRIRWGTNLRWKEIGTKTYFEPLIEIGWGSEVGSSIKVRNYKHFQGDRFFWRVENDSLSGSITRQTDGTALELSFNDSPDSRLTAMFIDERIRPGSNHLSNLQIGFTGDRRGGSIILDWEGKKGNNVRLGGRLLNQAGELILRDESDATLGEAEELTSSLYGIKAEYARTVLWNLKLWTEASYDWIKGSAYGWIDDELPPSFSIEILDGRYFFFDGKARALRLGARASKELGPARATLEVGFATVQSSAKLKDTRPGLHPDRTNKLSLKSFDAVWLTLATEYRFGNFKFLLSGSQGFLPTVRLDGEPLTGSNSKAAGGYIVSTGISFLLD